MWWAPDHGAWADSRNPRRPPVGEQPHQTRGFQRHLWVVWEQTGRGGKRPAGQALRRVCWQRHQWLAWAGEGRAWEHAHMRG